MQMTARNLSMETTFTLLGFTDYPELQVPLFLVFLIMYIITITGNLGMIVIITSNPKFHNPMYFFLSHLSFVDFCYSSIITPKLLENLVMADKSIFYFSCMLQYFLSCTAVVTESFLLAVMAYDLAMSQRLCSLLVAGSYLWGTFSPLVLLCYALQLKFSGHNVINHFFCEYTALIAVLTSDIHIPHLLLFAFATFNEDGTVSTLLIILNSYVFIFVTVSKICSASGRHKAFSTCASHLTAITIFHGTILSLYCVPNSKNSRQAVKVLGSENPIPLMVNPMLNPLIYSLKNKDVKAAFWKLMSTKVLLH
uniref:G-protein coupled receptors family 1 profile domain-containing protein n=1 Tax=Castor canadensis TaxID=51338 RepID=A0A8C0VZU0_CASCN